MSEPPAGLPLHFLPARQTASSAGSIIAVVGGALIALGTLMPWMTSQSGYLASAPNVVGLETPEGPVALVLGILTLAVSVVRIGTREHLVQRAITALAAVLAEVVAFADIHNIRHRLADYLSSSSHDYTGTDTPIGDAMSAAVGIGLYVVIVGAALAGVGALVTRREITGSAAAHSDPPPPPSPPPSAGDPRSENARRAQE